MSLAQQAEVNGGPTGIARELLPHRHTGHGTRCDGEATGAKRGGRRSGGRCRGRIGQPHRRRLIHERRGRKGAGWERKRYALQGLDRRCVDCYACIGCRYLYF